MNFDAGCFQRVVELRPARSGEVSSYVTALTELRSNGRANSVKVPPSSPRPETHIVLCVVTRAICDDAGKESGTEVPPNHLGEGGTSENATVRRDYASARGEAPCPRQAFIAARSKACRGASALADKAVASRRGHVSTSLERGRSPREAARSTLRPPRRSRLHRVGQRVCRDGTSAVEPQYRGL